MPEFERVVKSEEKLIHSEPYLLGEIKGVERSLWLMENKLVAETDRLKILD